ncbi:MAG: hypothetical protein WBP16_12205 [Ferruginibacter sp.]
MKILLNFLAVVLVLSACNNPAADEKNNVANTEAAEQKFFPVTSFLKGEIFEIKKSGINPLKYTTVNNHTDSVWLKIEDIDNTVKEFLTPEIDSANLITLFTEKSFLDQSINAITLTYDANGPLPDSMKLKHWDIYIDPETQKIKRIYMVKEISRSTTLQLTWVSRQWCKITTIVTDKAGVSSVDKEEKLNWDF